ncbi:vWA domain-containing protein [Flectobacillus major]|uniref:vWA domain-containing protein n=1 Tax=Flectobacillus major TaxID=103 RepID=UPI0004125ADC|nr:VWA domain-containing protein [Flectobacillus major]
MNWNADLGQTEKLFIALFIIIYIFYLIRVFWIAKKLKTIARSSVLKFILRSVYFSLLIMALMDPYFGDINGTIKAEGRDIFLLVDISKSMDATDVQPSRIEKAKFEMNRLVNHFTSDRVGVIVFSEDAFLLSPLTFDRNAINLFIPRINTDLLPQGGTNYNPALELALEKLLKAKTNNKSKVIVLISDGENFGNFDNTLLTRIRRNGINLFTVGLGTADGTTLKEGKFFKKDEDGNVVITRLDSDFLKKMAAETRGNYLEINSVSDSFVELITEVEKISANLIDQRVVTVTANKYFYFLIVALFLLGIDVFFTVRTFQL